MLAPLPLYIKQGTAKIAALLARVHTQTHTDAHVRTFLLQENIVEIKRHKVYFPAGSQCACTHLLAKCCLRDAANKGGDADLILPG